MAMDSLTLNLILKQLKLDFAKTSNDYINDWKANKSGLEEISKFFWYRF